MLYFIGIVFHVVCNIAVCECKISAKFQRSNCTTNKVCLPKESDSELPETSHQ